MLYCLTDVTWPSINLKLATQHKNVLITEKQTNTLENVSFLLLLFLQQI